MSTRTAASRSWGAAQCRRPTAGFAVRAPRCGAAPSRRSVRSLAQVAAAIVPQATGSVASYVPLTVLPSTRIVRDVSGSTDEERLSCSPVCCVGERATSALPTDGCASLRLIVPSWFESATLVGHVELPDGVPRIETSCVWPVSSPVTDRWTVSLSLLRSSVPEPLTPEPFSAVSEVVKCCAALLLGGVVLGAGLPDAVDETHLPKALAPVPHVEAKLWGPRVASELAHVFAAFLVDLMLTLSDDRVCAVMHEA